MEFIRNRRNKIYILGLLTAICLTGCGSKAASDTKVTAVLTGEKGDTETEASMAETDSEASESTGSTKTDSGERDFDRTVSVYGKIPVYGKEDKVEIEKLLAGLPDEFLNYEQQKELGLLSGWHSKYFYSEEEGKACEEEWLEFYTKNNEHDQMLERGKRGEAIHDIGRETAVILLNYTIEGDPIYEYISYINGTYFWYSDSSRDEFGSGEPEYGAFEELRAHSVKKEKLTEFYLLKDSGMSSKEIEEVLASEEGYGEKLVYVYAVEGTNIN